MKLKDLMNDIKKRGVQMFVSKKPGVTVIIGKWKDELIKVEEIYNATEYVYNIWENFYNNKWYTFIKNCKIAKENSKLNKKHDYQEDVNDEWSNTYGKYEGTYAQDKLGYSDEFIDTVLDGVPDFWTNLE